MLKNKYPSSQRQRRWSGIYTMYIYIYRPVTRNDMYASVTSQRNNNHSDLRRNSRKRGEKLSTTINSDFYLPLSLTHTQLCNIYVSMCVCFFYSFRRGLSTSEFPLPNVNSIQFCIFTCKLLERDAPFAFPSPPTAPAALWSARWTPFRDTGDVTQIRALFPPWHALQEFKHSRNLVKFRVIPPSNPPSCKMRNFRQRNDDDDTDWIETFAASFFPLPFVYSFSLPQRIKLTI